MSFSQSSFEMFYPEEEGEIEARKRLVSCAKQARDSGFSFWEWEKWLSMNKEYTFYISLLPAGSLRHIGSWVWVGLN